MASEKQVESDTKVLQEQKPIDELELALGTNSVVLSSGNGERETVLQSESKANLHQSARPTGRFS